MKILWIEDFFNKPTNKDRVYEVKRFFGKFVSGIENLLDDLSKSEDAGSSDLVWALSQNTDPIYWGDGFYSGVQAISDGFQGIDIGFNGSYDFVVLDAHLPLTETTELLSENSFSEKTRSIIEHFSKEKVMPEEEMEAGLTLYFFLLVKQNFPDDRMVFLSAHEEAEKINSKFKEVKAVPPKVFLKNDPAEMRHFADLLKSYSNDKYIILGRSLYDGCAHLLDNIGNYHFRFNEFIGSRRQKLDDAEIRDYLENLQSFLPARLSPFDPKQKGSQLNAFIRVLLHQWDDKARWQNMEVQNKDDRETQSFSKIVKNVRNWSAHSNLFEDADEKLAAFLFLVNMRVMFALPDEILPYERQTLKLYSEPLNAGEMANLIDRREIPLARTYERIKNLSAKSYRDSIYFEGMLTNLGQSGQIEELIRNRQMGSINTTIFQMFWHVLSPAKLDNVVLSRGQGEKNVGVWYTFDICDYGKNNEESFIFQLARHIYKESFGA